MKYYVVNSLYNNLNEREEVKRFDDFIDAKSFYDCCVETLGYTYELEHHSNRFYRDTVGVELAKFFVDLEGYEECVEMLGLDTYSYDDYIADHAE